MSKDLPIYVVGAGLGGVAAALGLARKGWNVRIIEATPELGVIGYGTVSYTHLTLPTKA